ncbi:MAG: valine--tRNA ligase [Gammaproteobacteria bacterium]|nr:valine--tRNA ligase [Gammaproteobacteria bacterium]
METRYSPDKIEQRWYQEWEEKGYFSPRTTAGSEDQTAYCIMIPPPNVTGSLHMGHAFQDTIMDALIRYHRMKGDNTLWQPGTDHAGIATQMVVERQLLAQGKSRHDLGREPFIERIWEWRNQSGGTITQQLRRMGSSLDWSRERFTMDEGLSAAVREVFISLYDEGLIYRGKRLVNWDPVLHTAVSDLEVVSSEEHGYMWHFRYPIADGSGHLEVATTRPETMLGDSAVAVHPDDERYQSLIGKRLILPLVGREIPIIADDYVDPEFGTGCVKITPAHDFNDYAVGKRHHLAVMNVLTIDACMNEACPEKYRGLDRFEARDLIVQDMKEAGLLVKVDDHKLMVPRGDRSHSVIEPLLTDQWYVKVKPLAEPAIEAVENGSIRFVPDNWKNTYFEWMRNIEDWCISRQIWWGHRIPAWYDDEGNLYVAASEEEVRTKYGLMEKIQLRQDDDVLDTWFSSALWPFSTLGWPEEDELLKSHYPTSVLVTGFDIIFFWVARMIMMGLKFRGDVPFKEVYIHGLVRDAHGQKMSKSKGNVLDPIDLIDGIDLDSLVIKRTKGLMQPQMAQAIEKMTREDFPQGIPAYGTDALRFTFASLASTGRDINFDLGRIEGYRNFCNKIWNAARFVLMNVGGDDTPDTFISKKEELVCQHAVADRWIKSRLQQTLQRVEQAVESYRFDLYAQEIYEFTWNLYCDWYLELSKIVLNSADSDPSALLGTKQTLIEVLETVLRMLHPVMPYLSEEIWQQVVPYSGSHGPSIMLAPYPVSNPALEDQDAEVEMEWLMTVVVAIRKIRSGMEISPSKRLPLLLQNGSDQDKSWAKRNLNSLQSIARLESVNWLEAGVEPPESATTLLGELKVMVPMAGIINREAELNRVEKEIERLKSEIARLEGKLANQKFTTKAPEAVVTKERLKLGENRDALEKMKEQKRRFQVG